MRDSIAFGAAIAAVPLTARAALAANTPLFKISLAQWSWNRQLRGMAEPHMDNLDFPAEARKLDIEAVEFVNQFFFDKAKDMAYLRELKKRCDDAGVKTLLIMCDREGALGDPDGKKRKQAVENHYKWADAAKFLGCHSIRVNAQSAGTWDEQIDLAADGLSRLTEYAAKQDLNVIVENHGGLSSNGDWIARVMKRVNHQRCGTLPDFGNFRLSSRNDPIPLEYDRYRGVKEMMPWAKGVSAKSHDFDERGEETSTDYRRMLKIVLDAGYRGYIGIEYEGSAIHATEGIKLTKRLLERVRDELSASYGG